MDNIMSDISQENVNFVQDSSTPLIDIFNNEHAP